MWPSNISLDMDSGAQCILPGKAIPRKAIPRMTYTVTSWMLNPIHSLTLVPHGKQL